MELIVHYIRKHSLIFLVILMVLLTSFLMLINEVYLHYPHHPLFLAGTWLVGVQLPLIYAVINVMFGSSGKMAKIIKESIHFYCIYILLGCFCTAIQYTPFPTIDKHIVLLESFLRIDSVAILSWAHEHLLFRNILDFCYNGLEIELVLAPFLLILFGRTVLLRDFFYLILITALVGASFYYFFPTTAPASIIDSPYFTKSQHATHLKFEQLHQYIIPTTHEGGLIAMPSFHVIWAWICLYVLRIWPILFFILLPYNILLTASCVILGWHYLTDVLGSLVVMWFAYFYNKKILGGKFLAAI